MQSTNKLGWIDELRGVAILMVIAVHASHGLKGYESFLTDFFSFGGFGVQLFFVASAITLCMSLERNLGRENWLKSYAVRRFFRIAPMYYVGIAIYFFWSFAKSYIQHGVFEPLGQYTVVNILANVIFMHGFFPDAYNNIVPGGWSIAVETSFYVIFPWVFISISRNTRFRFVQTVALLVICYFIAAIPQIYWRTNTVENDFLYFNISNQLQVFIVGIYGYYCLGALHKAKFIYLIGLVLALWSAGFGLWNSNIFNARYLTLMFYAAAFVVLAAIFARTKSTNKLLTEIGRRSFSMYVLHFMVMNVIEYVFNNRLHLLENLLEAKAALHYVVAVAITFTLSGFTKRYIEDRFIRYGSTIIARF